MLEVLSGLLFGGETPWEDMDTPTDIDITLEAIQPCPIDDHLTCGIQPVSPEE